MPSVAYICVVLKYTNGLVQDQCVYQQWRDTTVLHQATDKTISVVETKAGPSVRDQQLSVTASNFLHISLQINVYIFQNSDQDWQLLQLSPEHWIICQFTMRMQCASNKCNF